MSEATAMPERPTPLEWALRPFSKVHRGEGLQALLMSLCLFFVLCGYYLMKTAREGMVLVSGAWGLRGEEVKSYGGGAMALLLVGLVPAYSALASRSSRLRLINGSYAALIGSLLVFYVLAHLGVPIGLPFFVWIGLVNIFMVALFWSYANDLYTEEQGKRLFAIIAIGGSLGAVVGPELATRVSTFGLLPFAAVLLVVGLGMFNLIDRLNTRTASGKVIGKQPIEGKGIADLLFHNRYLLLIGALVFVAELVKTNGEYVLSSVATRHAALLIPSTAHPELVGAARKAAVSADRRDLITAFYGIRGDGVTGSRDEVPLTELPTLGGGTFLRGYPFQRFRDRVAAVGSVAYEWDLSDFVNAYVFTDMGRVYSSLDDLTLRGMRVGYGIGASVQHERSFLLEASLASSIDGGLFLNLSFHPGLDARPRWR